METGVHALRPIGTTRIKIFLDSGASADMWCTHSFGRSTFKGSIKQFAMDITIRLAALRICYKLVFMQRYLQTSLLIIFNVGHHFFFEALSNRCRDAS
jgi:hypothetical protein